MYRIGYLLHHKFFLKKGRPLKHAQMVIVGSYRIGGAGKTPLCIWLATELYEEGKKTAILCHSSAKDEFELLKNALPTCTVIATRNRYSTAHEIDDLFDIIICDDGFEDSRLDFANVICLEWEKEPKKLSEIFPAGFARSFPKDHSNIKLHLRCFGENPDIRFSIQGIYNTFGIPPKSDKSIILVAGIGDPDRFFRDMESTGLPIKGKIRLRDHSPHLENTVVPLLARGEQIVITEKDACRLREEVLTHKTLFIAKLSIDVSQAIRKKMLYLFK